MSTTSRDQVRSWGRLICATSCCALALFGCSSSDGGTTGTGGKSGTGGSTATGGATASGGATGSGGASSSGGATGTGGVSTTGGATGSGGAGTGGNTGTGGGASGGASATGGAVGTGGGAAGASGTGGAAGATAGTGGAGGGTSCAGNAISLSANGTAAASDAARARVMVDLMTDLPINNAMRTLEFWAYIKTTDWVGESNTIFEYGTQGGGTAHGFGLDFGAGTVMGMAGNHATLDPYTNGGFDNDSTNYLGVTSTMNQWVHLAMVWNGTNLITYVNGVARITTAGAGATMLATTQTQLTIGCNNPRFSCFNGYIDEFRVWGVARTPAEIMANYNKALTGNETGLVGYWKFNDAPGSAMAADSVTRAGHTAHPGIPMAVAANQTPTFVAPNPPAPILCP